jgi:hypothetical protein
MGISLRAVYNSTMHRTAPCIKNYREKLYKNIERILVLGRHFLSKNICIFFEDNPSLWSREYTTLDTYK